MSKQIHHRSVPVDGIHIFYREAGDPARTSLLLLHGFPTSSIMFTRLMTVLAEDYHLVAPDYPGFGFSDFPPVQDFEYSFQNVSRYINRFTSAIGLDSFLIYLHDYGSYIGMRICLNHPEKILGLIIQNGNNYLEGHGPGWAETKAYWANPTEEKRKEVYAFLSAEGTKDQYYAGVPDPLKERISPESWILDWERMSRPGNLEMQYQLNMTYPSNFELFPAMQAWFRNHQPPALVIWGKHDVYFDVAEAACYHRDLPDAEVHLLEGGHMVLETNFDEVVDLLGGFLKRIVQ